MNRSPLPKLAAVQRKHQPENQPRDCSSLPKLDAAQHAASDTASTRPPKSCRNVEAKRPPGASAKPQPDAKQQVTATLSEGDSDLLQHGPGVAGDASSPDEPGDPCEFTDSVSVSDETNWSDIAEFIAAAAAVEKERPRQQRVLKPTPTPTPTPRNTARRNLPLTQSEEDQVLLLVSHGFSLRQAATAIGCHNSTITKRAQRDEAFAAAIGIARQKARTDPLHAIREASKRSWRAAAWLLNYLDRRDNRGQRSSRESPTTGERRG